MNDNICPVSHTLNLIGGKYKPLILWHCSSVKRFNALRKLIPTASAKVLTSQLRDLENDGLISRKVYPVVPPKVEYTLTKKGRTIYPILELMYSWGEAQLKSSGKCPNCSMKD
ncbi:MAG: winged helix-turn-helix transcriptional regulator [Bacilli bacterium]